MTTKLPEIGCSYIAPNQCTGFAPPSCCERIDDKDKDKDTNAGVVVITCMALLLILSALAVVL